MLHLAWIVGALWVTGITYFLCRHQRRANPRKFWLEAAETAVVLIGMYTWVEIAAWLTT